MALAISWEPTTRLLAAHDFEAAEIQCRSHYQQEYAKRKAAVASDQIPANPKEDADPEKAARDYCVQRRAAIAGERQGDIAKLAAGVSFIALLAAFAAVVFARRTVDTMRDTAKRQLRAYVSLTVNAIGNFGIVHPIALDCGIKNHGSTPAFKINCTVDMGVFPNPLPAGFRLPAPTIQVRRNVTLFPHDDRPYLLRHSRALTAVEHANAMTGTHRFHFWGTMVYEDIFGVLRPTKLHVSVGGDEFIASMAAATAGQPPLPFRMSHEDEHHQIEENEAAG